MVTRRELLKGRLRWPKGDPRGGRFRSKGGSKKTSITRKAKVIAKLQKAGKLERRIARDVKAKGTAFIESQKEDGFVNAAGLAGSIAGGAVGGPLGAIAGDLAGAVAVRGAIKLGKAAATAKSKLRAKEAFKAAKNLEKIKRLGAETLSELKRPEVLKKVNLDAVGDVAGWAVGNGSAMLVARATSRSIPLVGAAFASVVVPQVVKQAEKLL